jgi:hypothetical protein
MKYDIHAGRYGCITQRVARITFKSTNVAEAELLAKLGNELAQKRGGGVLKLLALLKLDDEALARVLADALHAAEDPQP